MKDRENLKMSCCRGVAEGGLALKTSVFSEL
jgi:hypothetical protein